MTKKLQVHQVLVGVARNDAISKMAFEIHHELVKYFKSCIFSYHPIDASLPDFVRSFGELEQNKDVDVLVYHLSFGVPAITELLLEHKARIVLVYHNVTPHHFYSDILPQFAEALEYGRQEPTLLKDKVVLAIADSVFNADELRSVGYKDVKVIPGGADPHRLRETNIDSEFLARLTERFSNGYVLFVSQVLPHKRVDHAIEIVHILRSFLGLDIGLVVAGPIRQPLYAAALEELKNRLGGDFVFMTNEVSDEQLATLYRACLCYIGTSQHEGLSLPVLEAMANRAPIVVRGAGALSETVKNGGIVLSDSVGVVEFAEVVAEVINNRLLQSYLRQSGFARLHEQDFSSSVKLFVDAVKSITI